MSCEKAMRLICYWVFLIIVYKKRDVGINAEICMDVRECIASTAYGAT